MRPYLQKKWLWKELVLLLESVDQQETLFRWHDFSRNIGTRLTILLHELPKQTNNERNYRRKIEGTSV